MHVKRLCARMALVLFVLVFSVTSYPRAAGALTYADLCAGFTRFGRNGCHGYFTNTNFYTTFIEGWNVLNCELSQRGCVNGESKNNALPSSINTATEFEDEIGYYLSSGYSYNHAGAAFIIDTMLGRSGSSFGSVTAGINYAVANFDNWKTNYVDYYASKGWITWDQSTTLGAGTINTMHNCSVNYNCTQDNVSSHDGRDFTFFRNPDPEPSHLLIFNNPGGTKFEIRRECANLVGSMSPLTKKPPVTATATCDGFTRDVTAPDPNRAFNLTASIQISPATSASGMFGPDQMKVALTGPSGYAGVSSTTGSPTISSGDVSASLHVPPTNVSGTFTVTWQITGSQAPTKTCSDTFDIAYVPYFTVRGGDVSAGQGFGTGCTDNPSADIDGENLDDGSASPNYFGAAASNAAIATGEVDQFASDTINNVPSNLGGSSDGLSADQPGGLTFANDDPDIAPAYGGDALGSWPGNWCVPDYAGNVSGPTSGPLPADLSTLTRNADGYLYEVSGRHVLGNFTLKPGVHVTVVVKGDIFVEGNIYYSSYTSLEDIPQFTLISDGGNIYIDSDMTELHGFYVAQPDSSGNNGQLYTCAQRYVGGYEELYPGDDVNYYNDCKHPLVMYGSMAAEQIVPGWTVGDVAKGGAVTDDPAEQFVYTPEMWLGSLKQPSVSCADDQAQSQCMYQAYTNLPPVF